MRIACWRWRLATTRFSKLPAFLIRLSQHRLVKRVPIIEVVQIHRILGRRRKRGASTVSQQTAKNLFLWPGRSVVRKALEFPLALWLDLVLGKRRLMEILIIDLTL